MPCPDRQSSVQVSVIVAIHNVEPYLSECLDSLVHQTLGGIEIVAVNDGSTDGSEAILEEFAAKYPGRIKAIHKPNGGLSDARNVGIDHSSGEYLGFVDADDWVGLDMYEQLYNEAVSSGSDIVVCAHNAFHDEDHPDTPRRVQEMPVRGTYLDFGQSVIENPRLLFASRSYAWNKLYRRELFVDGKHRFPVGMWFEDSATIYNVMLDANRIACVFDGLYNYRIREEGSITSSLTPKIFDIFDACDLFLDYYQKRAAGDERLDSALETIARVHITKRFDLFGGRTPWRAKLLGLRYIFRAFAYLDGRFPGWSDNKKIGVRKRLRYLACMYALSPYALKSLASKMTRDTRRIDRTDTHETDVVALRKYGYEILGEVDSVLRAHADLHFADDDTLLGLVREGAFLPGTQEISLGIFAGEANKAGIAEAMQGAGYVLRGSYSLADRVLSQLYCKSREGTHIQLRFSYYDAGEETCETYRLYTDPFVTYDNEGSKSVLRMTHGPIGKTTSASAGGINVPVPEHAEKFLEEKYGEMWRTCTSVAGIRRSPAAIVTRSIATLEKG